MRNVKILFFAQIYSCPDLVLEGSDLLLWHKNNTIPLRRILPKSWVIFVCKSLAWIAVLFLRCYADRMKIVKIKSWGMPPEFITILNTAAGEELLVEDENEIPDPEDKRTVGDESDSNAPEPTKK